jgi:hypothetical protein
VANNAALKAYTLSAVHQLLEQRREQLCQHLRIGAGQCTEPDRLAHHLKSRDQGKDQRGALLDMAAVQGVGDGLLMAGLDDRAANLSCA